MKTNAMATCTDTFRFNDQKIFETVRACLPDEKSQTQNLIECRDDLLFVWNAKNSSLLTLNWRTAKVQGEGKVGYQVSTLLTLPV
jgi:nuclear pore complex protein Nup88